MKFLLTKELGRLAKWLRILGFDAEYFTENNAGSLIIQALRDERIILSRNRRLAKARGVKTIFISSEKIKEQVPEVLKALNIEAVSDKMFTRCILCNTALIAVGKDKIKALVPEYVFETQERFFSCPECGRIYWQGSHWGNVVDTLKELKGQGT
ncbi:MAG: Mut7-C RNAse domain-containing protein [Candidatus Omnitrophica bacterium]|nr:Mut7-C RNAse domain-containing protein [Candidatus Omnitrophota bacterium]